MCAHVYAGDRLVHPIGHGERGSGTGVTRFCFHIAIIISHHHFSQILLKCAHGVSYGLHLASVKKIATAYLADLSHTGPLLINLSLGTIFHISNL